MGSSDIWRREKLFYVYWEIWAYVDQTADELCESSGVFEVVK